MTQPTTAPRRPRTVRPRLDAVAAAAVELAREALLEVTEPGQVGEHLRAEASGDRIVTHVFECTMPGYRGWSWVVVVTRAARAKAATVAETALLPGEDAILAPEWEPWSERLKPEDIGADDLLPYRDEDPRLEQGYEATDEEDADAVALWELGLGRPRVLSPQGRAEAAERWIDGDFGPRETSGRGRRGTISANCSSCGFLSKLSGSLRGKFGVCTNEWSPADGKVVHLGFGCGSHSETGQEEADREIPRAGGVVVDELDVELQTSASDEASEATTDAAPNAAPDAASEDAAEKPVDAVVTVGPATGEATPEEPATDAPATDVPATDAPATAAPVTDASAAEVPEADSAEDVQAATPEVQQAAAEAPAANAAPAADDVPAADAAPAADDVPAADAAPEGDADAPAQSTGDTDASGVAGDAPAASEDGDAAPTEA
ncbi:DUF3027 domain-containing protein [Brachybacterium tyrofermentans]|uniref:DUF3027 domain-containing protein n=1 Tax=Brachybacterium tyrofermentans TaxID=47848 RepID=A0ABW0FH89_9MICO